MMYEQDQARLGRLMVALPLTHHLLIMVLMKRYLLSRDLHVPVGVI